MNPPHRLTRGKTHVIDPPASATTVPPQHQQLVLYQNPPGPVYRKTEYFVENSPLIWTAKARTS